MGQATITLLPLIVISNNTASVEAAIVDGGIPTGFTFTQVSPGYASSDTIGLDCFCYGPDGSYFWALSRENGNAVGGFPVTSINSAASCPQINTNTEPNTSIGEIVGTDVSQQMFRFSVSALPSAGTFIQLSRAPLSTIKAWFRVDGAGSLPAGTGTPIRIDLTSSMGSTDSAYCIAQSLSGNSVWTVQVKSGNLITPNSYFSFISKTQQYVVWYNLNGAGSQPSIPGAILIAITYSSSDSLQSIELKTISAINRVYFKVPDMRGMYIKGWANGSSVDKNVGLRYSANSTRFEHPQLNLPAYIGSYTCTFSCKSCSRLRDRI